MTVDTSTIPKGPAATPKPKHGCCGGEMETPANKASTSGDHDHSEHEPPAKAAESSSCCGGASKESSRPT